MGFQQGLSGLNIASKNLDVIGNNVANASTVGFKSGQAQFADVFAASLSGAGASPVGLGARVSTVAQQFTQGNVTSSNNPLDIAVNGGGFYRMSDTAGTVTYSRNGQFQFDKNDYIVNANGLRLNGYLPNSSGTIQSGAPAPIQLDRSDVQPLMTGGLTGTGTGVEAYLNLDSRKPAITTAWPGVVGGIVDPSAYNDSTSLPVYDSLGNPHQYTLYFSKDSVTANTWNVHATVVDISGNLQDVSNGVGLSTLVPSRLQFDTSGKLLAGTGQLVQHIPNALYDSTAANVVSNGDFNVNFKDPTGATTSATAQFGGNFTINSLRQDGYTVGKLSGFNISADGTIVGRYTNGQSRNLAQVVLAGFANPQGLQAVGNNQWTASSDSGTELIGTPGSDGQHGTLQSSAVEDSNVDLTAELVNMITAQRVYQANAQSIKTQDQVLQTLVNLR